MSHALQVSFLRVAPSEDLVSLASAAYREMQRTLREHSECLVALSLQEGRKRALVQTTVQLRAHGAIRAESQIIHKSPRIALKLALAQVQAQLGVFGDANGLFGLRHELSA